MQRHSVNTGGSAFNHSIALRMYYTVDGRRAVMSTKMKKLTDASYKYLNETKNHL